MEHNFFFLSSRKSWCDSGNCATCLYSLSLSLTHTHSHTHTNFHIKKDCLCNQGALSVVRQKGLDRSASFRCVQSVTQSVVFALNQLKELQCWVSVAITKNPLRPSVVVNPVRNSSRGRLSPDPKTNKKKQAQVCTDSQAVPPVLSRSLLVVSSVARVNLNSCHQRLCPMQIIVYSFFCPWRIAPH